MSSGLPAAEKTCNQLGLEFDPWQRDTARCILSKDAAGTYAADTVVLSIPRQVGKTFLVGALVFADSIINSGTTTVWTAHRFKVARETFNELRALAKSPALEAHIDPDDIYTAAGNESITFLNGSRILFAARERGAVRGFSKVRRLILDEAQILTESVMADLAPTQNQATNPQIIMMGTPPKPTDPGEVFTNLRTEALEGRSEGIVYIEFSAPAKCNLDDVEAWSIANPSLFHRTPLKAIKRLRKLLASDADFAREALGIWGTSIQHVIDLELWQSLATTETAPDPLAFAIDVTPDRAAGSIGMAGRQKDAWRVEVVDAAGGTAWIIPRAEQLKSYGVPLALDPSSPAGSLLPGLKEVGIEPLLISTREMGQACGLFYDTATAGNLRHFNQARLNVALAAAKKRNVSDAWMWSRRDATDISPLVAVTEALFVAYQPEIETESVYEQRGLVSL